MSVHSEPKLKVANIGKYSGLTALLITDHPIYFHAFYIIQWLIK
jgi:hypothetical protein